MKDLYVTINHVDYIEEAELDFENREPFEKELNKNETQNIGDYDDDYDGPEYIEIDNTEPKVLAIEIDIDKLVSIVQNFKAKGATHIRMKYHPDHHGYEFEAVEMRLSTDEEIEDYEQRRLEYIRIAKEIRAIRTEHNLLIRELEKTLPRI